MHNKRSLVYIFSCLVFFTLCGLQWMSWPLKRKDTNRFIDCMNQGRGDFNLWHTQLNSTQSWVSLIFLRNHTKTTTTNRTVRHFFSAFSLTFSQLLHNQTRPNSVCNLISTQLEDSCKKMCPPLPPKNKKNTQIFKIL